jgi:hypothetical protein
MNLILDKTEKNRKKPVETEEIGLTKSAEKPKVNCGRFSAPAWILMISH